ncbi:MAG: hypothetical protein Q9211_005516 [Gyalolechia sp. 1 TL-2023]
MSNFAHSLTGAHICLRCRLRFPTPIAQLSSHVRLPGTVPQGRSFSVQPNRSQELGHIDDSSPNAQFLSGNPSSFLAGSSYENDDIKLPSDGDRKRHLTDTGIYIKRPRIYSRRALGVDTLGKPAEVLRLPDVAPRASEYSWWDIRREGDEGDESPTPTEPLTSSDILQRVTSERGLVSASRVKENIERLKREWLSTLTQPDLPPSESDCYELGRKVHDGFTVKQLLDYINEAGTTLSTSLTDLNNPFRSALLIRSERRAGVTPFPGNTVKRLQALSAESRNRPGQRSSKTCTRNSLVYERQDPNVPIKYLLVDKILRQYWNIRSKEELESAGEVDVHIPGAYLELINSHERNGLLRVANEFDAKIDVLKAESILRITANHATCVSTLKFLSLMLDEVAYHETFLGELGNSVSTAVNYRTLLNDRLLREVEKLSNTAIRWNTPTRAHLAEASPNKLLIYYLKNSGNSLAKAKMFLKQSLRPTRDIATSVYLNSDPSTLANLISVPVETGWSLPLTDSGVAWARKSDPSHERRNRGQTMEHESTAPVLQETLTAIMRQFRLPDARERREDRFDLDSKSWQSRPCRELSVSFGRLLYPLGDNTSKGKRGAFVGQLTGHRVFSTEVPGIRRTLELQEVRMFEVQEQLCVRMNAARENTENTLEQESLPDLELRLRYQPGEEEAHLETVRLILEEKQADLLLPHEHVDLRFATQKYLTAEENIDPRILKFVKSIDFRNWGFSLDDRPQILTVGIPQQVLRPDKVARQGNDCEKLIDYSLGSIERRAVAYGRPSQGEGEQQFQISLAAIEKGPLGGRRQELRLFEDGRVSKQAVTGLYLSARRIVEGLRAESRGEVKPASPKSLRRMKQVVMGYRGTKKGKNMILWRRSNVVRRRLTDIPFRRRGFLDGEFRRGPPIRATATLKRT